MIENLHVSEVRDTIIYVAVIVTLGAVISGAIWAWLDDVFGDL